MLPLSTKCPILTILIGMIWSESSSWPKVSSSLRFLVSRRSCLTSSRMSGRPSTSRLAVSSVSSEIESSELRMARRSCFRPPTNWRNVVMVFLSSASRSPSMSRTSDKFVMTSPISWSRPASVLVNDETRPRRLWTLPASPCSVWTISNANLLVSSGVSASNTGLKPLSNTFRSSASCVRSKGMVLPGFNAAVAPSGPWARAMYRCPTRLRKRRVAVVFWVSWTSFSTLKVTNALSFWTISTSLIAPTDTPAIRTSSPLATPVTSVKTALYSSRAPNPPLLRVRARTSVAMPVRAMNASSLMRAESDSPSSFIGPSPPLHGPRG